MSEATEETRSIKFSRVGDSEKLTKELSNLDGVIGLLIAEDWLEVSYDAAQVQ